jgi:hypothetical protein
MLMGVLFKRYKTKFRYALKPLFAMLVARQRSLDKVDWMDLVKRTGSAVQSNPLEFLGDDLPEANLLRDVLDEIFHEFLKERAFHKSTSEKKMMSKIFKET